MFSFFNQKKFTIFVEQNKENMKDAGGPILVVGLVATVCMLISSYLTIMIFS